MIRYFSGSGDNMGVVSAMNTATFEGLCSRLVKPFPIALTREAYHKLEAKAQMVAKRVNYIVPAAFISSPSKRKTEFAQRVNLVCLDIDGKTDKLEGNRTLERGFGGLGSLGYIAWETASSTAEHRRLRVVVHAENIPLNLYPQAVRTVAEMLGLAEVNSESLIAVQPMFWPTIFAGETESPIRAQEPEGEPFTTLDVIGEAETTIPIAEQRASGARGTEDSVDLEYLRMPMEGVKLSDAEGALETLDPDCTMAQWIEVAMGLKHQFGEEGYALWDKWSARGKKYVDAEETEYRWGTLQAQPSDRAPVTIRSVFRQATARGWSNPTLAKNIHAECLAWIKSPSRATEELMDQAIKRIAKAGPALGPVERKILMIALRDVLAGREMALPLPDIKREVRKLELEAARSTGIPPWAKGICYVSALNVFYRHTIDRRFSPEVLDLMYTSPKIGDDEKRIRPRDYLIQIAGVSMVENLRYDPAQGTKRFFTDDNKPYVNTYRPSYAAADPERASEAGDIFRRHIENLVAEGEHQRTLIDYLAYHVQFPGRKIRWAVLLQGTQGCGKTALAVAMAGVLGRRNIRKLAATNVLDGQHNDWAYGSQLVVMEEVRVVGSNRYGVMDKLKPCISDDDISLRAMYEPPQTVPNITNYLMFTNHHDSLAIHDDDRRYFVLASPLQSPADIVRIGGTGYFEKLFGMFRDNAGGLRAFFEGWPISSDFKPEGRAPVTKYLGQLAENSASPLAAQVAIAVSDEGHPLVRRNLLSLGCLRGVLDTEHLPEFSDQALAGVLREAGWTKVDRMMLDGAKHQIWVKNWVNGRDVRQAALNYLRYL